MWKTVEQDKETTVLQLSCVTTLCFCCCFMLKRKNSLWTHWVVHWGVCSGSPPRDSPKRGGSTKDVFGDQNPVQLFMLVPGQSHLFAMLRLCKVVEMTLPSLGDWKNFFSRKAEGCLVRQHLTANPASFPKLFPFLWWNLVVSCRIQSRHLTHHLSQEWVVLVCGQDEMVLHPFPCVTPSVTRQLAQCCTVSCGMADVAYLAAPYPATNTREGIKK